MSAFLALLREKFEGSIAIRIRWYGSEETMKTAFIERKTHREDWFGGGESSAKERFPLPAKHVAPFLQGTLTPAGVGELLRESKFKGDIDEAMRLAEEVQTVVREKQLRPTLRTHYMRTAFQRAGDATVRCSLDTEVEP